ncbi:unnamed protein product, partial [Meganyctiphanes norvegica]
MENKMLMLVRVMPGGPMTFANSNGLMIAIGLIAKGINCPTIPSSIGFYTNIIQYVDWIYEKTGMLRKYAPKINAITYRPPTHHTTFQRQPDVRFSGSTNVFTGKCGSYAAVSKGLSPLTSTSSSLLYEKGGTVSLHNSTTDLSSRTHFCGAALISDRFLLTAAHCMVYNNNKGLISINMGKEDLDENPFPGPNTYEVEDVYVHPAYENRHGYNDIAILKTKRKVKFSQKIWPFCLPYTGERLQDHSPVAVDGWGQIDQSSIIKRSFFNTVENNRCDNRWRKEASELYDVIKQHSYPNGLTNQILCAGKENIDACEGDAGGPMTFANNKGLMIVVGLIAKGINCPAIPSSMGFYTNVVYYLNWIHENTRLPRKSAPLINAPMPRPSPPPANKPSQRQDVRFNGPPNRFTGGCPSSNHKYSHNHSITVPEMHQKHLTELIILNCSTTCLIEECVLLQEDTIMCVHLEYAEEHCILFNGKKSKYLVCGNYKYNPTVK